MAQLGAINVKGGQQLQNDIKSVNPDNLLSSMITLSALKQPLLKQYPQSKISKLQSLESKARKNKYHRQTLEHVKTTTKQVFEINQNLNQMETKIKGNESKFNNKFLQDFTQAKTDLNQIAQKVQQVEFSLLNQFQKKQEQDLADYERELIEGKTKFDTEIQTRAQLIETLQNEKNAIDNQLKQTIVEYEEQQKLIDSLRADASRAVSLEDEIKQLNALNSVKVKENEELLEKFRIADGLNEEARAKVQDLLSQIENLNNELKVSVEKQSNESRQKQELILSLSNNEKQVRELEQRLSTIKKLNADYVNEAKVKEDEARAQIEQLESDLATVRLDYENLQNNKNLNIEELERQKTSLREQIEEQQVLLEEMKRQLKTKEELIEILNESEDQKQQSINTLIEEKIQLEGEIEQQRRLLVEAEDNNNRERLLLITKQNQAVELLQNQINQMQNDFQDKTDLIEKLEIKINQQQEELVQLQIQFQLTEEQLLRERQNVQIAQTQEKQSLQRQQQLSDGLNFVYQATFEEDQQKRFIYYQEIRNLKLDLDTEEFIAYLEGGWEQLKENQVLEDEYEEIKKKFDEQMQIQENLRKSSQQIIENYQQYEVLYRQLQEDLALVRKNINDDRSQLQSLDMSLEIQRPQTVEVQLLQSNIDDIKQRIRYDIEGQYRRQIDDLKNELSSYNVERRNVIDQIEQNKQELMDYRLLEEQAQIEQQNLIARIRELELEKLRYLEREDSEQLQVKVKNQVLNLIKNQPLIASQIVGVLNQQNRTLARYKNISQNILRQIKLEDIPIFIDSLLPNLQKIDPLSSQKIIDSLYFFLFRKGKPQIVRNQPAELLQEEEFQNLKYESSIDIANQKNPIQSTRNIGLSDEFRKKQFQREGVGVPAINKFDPSENDPDDELIYLRLLFSQNQRDASDIFNRGLSPIFSAQNESQIVLNEIEQDQDERSQILYNVPGMEPEGDGDGDNWNEVGKRKRLKLERRQDLPPDDEGDDDDDDDEYDDEMEDENENYIVRQPFNVAGDGGGGEPPDGGDQTQELFDDEAERRDDNYIAQIDVTIQSILEEIEGQGPPTQILSSQRDFSWEKSIDKKETNIYEIETVLRIMIKLYTKDKKDVQKKAALPVLKEMLKSVVRQRKSDEQKIRAQYDDVRQLSKMF